MLGAICDDFYNAVKLHEDREMSLGELLNVAVDVIHRMDTAKADAAITGHKEVQSFAVEAVEAVEADSGQDLGYAIVQFNDGDARFVCGHGLMSALQNRYPKASVLVDYKRIAFRSRSAHRLPVLSLDELSRVAHCEAVNTYLVEAYWPDGAETELYSGVDQNKAKAAFTKAIEDGAMKGDTWADTPVTLKAIGPDNSVIALLETHHIEILDLINFDRA